MSKLFLSIVSVFLLASCGGVDDPSQTDDREQSRLTGEGCATPVEAVLDVMQCIEDENPTCTDAGYNPQFRKLHNGIDTETPINRLGFWVGTFWLLDLKLDYDHVAQVGDNQVSLRYVETVSFRDGEEFIQHEHALITVDDNCKMILWDQYGDNQEQQAVDDKAAEFLPWGG